MRRGLASRLQVFECLSGAVENAAVQMTVVSDSQWKVFLGSLAFLAISRLAVLVAFWVLCFAPSKYHGLISLRTAEQCQIPHLLQRLVFILYSKVPIVDPFRSRLSSGKPRISGPLPPRGFRWFKELN